MKALLILLGLLIFPMMVVAADSRFDKLALESLEFENIVNEITAPKISNGDELVKHRIENEFWYVLILAAMAMISMLLVLWFLKQKDETTPKDIVNAAGLILIVFGTIILVLIVDTTEQLTAAIGILGAIAGYLFRSAQETVTVSVVKPQDTDGS